MANGAGHVADADGLALCQPVVEMLEDDLGGDAGFARST